MYFAAKGSVVTVEQLEEEVTLHSFAGFDQGFKGDYLATNVDGQKKILPKEYFEDYYVEVIVPSKEKKIQQSPFEQEYTKSLIECYQSGSLDQEEDWSDLQEKVNNRVENKV